MGSPLFEVLFEPNVGQQQDKIDFIIREVAEDQLPHITIQEVAIVQDERNVQVHISFLSTEDTELATRSIEVSKTAEVKTLAARFVS